MTPKRRPAALPAALTAAALALHVVVLRSAGALWRDEAQTFSVASSSLRQLWGYMGRESFPALFPVLLRLWLAVVPRGDAWLRLQGALIGTALLGSLWWAARRMGRAAPLLSVALVGFGAVFVSWGDCLRAYGLGSALLVAACASLWRLAQEPSAKNAAWAAALSILSVQCLYQNAALLAAILGAAALAARGRRGAVAALTAVGLAAALSLLPYAPALGAARGWFVRQDVGLARLVRGLAGAWTGLTPPLRWLWPALVSLTLAAPAAGARLGRRRGRVVFCAVAAAASIAALLAFYAAAAMRTQPWYFMPLLALLALLMDVALGEAADAVSRPGPRRLLSAAAAAAALLALPDAWSLARQRRTDVDLIAARLEREAAPADLIVLSPWFLGITFSRYYAGPAAWTTLPPLEDYRIAREDLVRRALAEAQPAAPVLRRMGAVLAAGGTVWLVGPIAPPARGADPPELPPLAPDAPGWSDEAYSRAFAQQAGAMLAARARVREAYPTAPPGAVSPLEDPGLVAVRGWRAAPPARPRSRPSAPGPRSSRGA